LIGDVSGGTFFSGDELFVGEGAGCLVHGVVPFIFLVFFDAVGARRDGVPTCPVGGMAGSRRVVPWKWRRRAKIRCYCGA
jgi:hypothetical protein